MKNYVLYFCTILICFLAQYIPVCFIWGSLNSWFGLSNIIAPVAACYQGFGVLLMFLFSSKTMTLSSLVCSCLHRLPLLASSYVYARCSSLIIPIISIICFVAFVVHPVGSTVWWYGLYWFIPIILWYLPSNKMSNALIATFIAHAIGSVIWLYTKNIPSEIWAGLVPVVAVERLTMAAGIVLFDLLYVWGCNCMNNLNTSYHKVAV